MGNIGRPSAGCLTCRKRKIKCDRAEPSCGKCQRIGKTCPGYRPESELLFRNQTENTVARSRRQYDRIASPATRPPSSAPQPLPCPRTDGASGNEHDVAPSPETGTTSCRRRGSASSSGPAAGLPLCVSGPVSLEREAMCLFMADHVQASENGWPQGHLECLPSMLRDAGPESCLSRAVYAAAYHYLYNLRGQPAAQSCARQCYSQSLESIHRALEDPRERLRDSTLLAVWLVGLYEIFHGVVQGVMEESTAWTSHVSGTALLLQLRGMQQFDTLQGRAIFRLAHGVTLIYALMSGNPPLIHLRADVLSPPPPHDWEPFDPRIRLTVFARAVCSLCSAIKAQARKPWRPDEDVRPVQRLKDGAFRIEAGMRHWTRHLPAWQPHLVDVSLHSMGIRQFAHSDLLEYHASSFSLLNWNLYRVSRVVLHTALLDLDRSLQADVHRHLSPERGPARSGQVRCISSLLTPDERQRCQNTLSNMSSQLLGTIPYVLGDIDAQGVVYNPLLRGPRAAAGKAYQGLTVVWSLRLIKRSRYTDDGQKHLATEALKKIGGTMGLRQALEVASM